MKHKGGRPPLDPADPTIRVSVSLTTSRYDDLCRRARLARMSLSEYLREIDRRLVLHKPTDPSSRR